MEKSKIVALADEFAGSARYRAIQAVFVAVDELEDGEPTAPLWLKMNRTTQDCTCEERDRIPDLFKQALALKGCK